MAAVRWSPFAALWRHRRVLFLTTVNEVRARHAGSVLGILWLLLYPLLFLGAYAVVYLYVFKVRFALPDSPSYVALIFCGLIPFLAVAEALSVGVGSVTANANLIKNTLFPIELVPVRTVLASQPAQIVGTTFLLIALAMLGKLTVWIALLPVIWAAQLFLTVGVVWILSSLNVYLRDLQNIVSVMVLMLMMLSPIAYSPDMAPESIRWLLRFNPLYYVIVSYQDCLLFGQAPREGTLWILLGLAALFYLGGQWMFLRLKKVFADNV